MQCRKKYSNHTPEKVTSNSEANHIPQIEPNYHQNAIITKYTEDDKNSIVSNSRLDKNSIVSNTRLDKNSIVRYPMRDNGEPMFLYGAPGVNFFLRAGAIGKLI